MKLDVNSAYSIYMGVGKYSTRSIQNYFRITEKRLPKHENGILVDLIGPFSMFVGEQETDLIIISDILEDNSLIFKNNLSIQEGVYHIDKVLVGLLMNYDLGHYDVKIQELTNLIDIIRKR